MTFSATVNDGFIYRGSLSYVTAFDYPTGYPDDVSSYMQVGQRNDTGLYRINRGFIPFDTSTLPVGVNLTSGYLSLYVDTDYSTADFNVTLQTGSATVPHTPLDEYDYFYGQYAETFGGTANTSTIVGAGYWNITLNSDGLGFIRDDSVTWFVLRSYQDFYCEPPSGDERIELRTREYGGESYAPTLYLTYETEGYRYIVHGPYYENGAVASALVNLTLQIENMASNTTTYLNGTDGVADTVSFNITNRGVVLTWNISSATSNYTRTYYLTSATFEEIYVFIPNTGEEAAFLYTFDLATFGVNLNDSYLETVLNVGGENRIIERQKADALNDVPFWFVWARHYSLRLVCGLGSYTWADFIALSETSQSLIVTRSMFPISVDQFTLYASAVRMNATWIQVNYTNPLNSTSWVYIAIKHVSGYGWATDIYQNTTDNIVSYNWYSADSATNYLVHVNASIGGTVYTWGLSATTPATTDDPWADYLDIFGTWPIPSKYLVGAFIVLCVLGTMSSVDVPLGIFLATIMAMILNYWRWLNVSWLALGFCLFISIVLALVEGARKQARSSE